MNLYETIESCYRFLTRGERKVADYYLVGRAELADKTLAEISEATGVGEATIVRFCRKLGFDSFKQVRLQLSLENVSELDCLQKGYVTGIEENIADVLHKTVELLELEELNKAVRLIKNTSRLSAVGVGASALSAQVMAMRFIRDGKPCQCIMDNHFQAMYSSYATEQDVIIAFSISGRAKDTLETVRIAKKNGAKIIAVTNYRRSPLGKMADVILLTSKKDGPLTSGNLVAQINQIFIGDLLTTGYCLEDEKQSIQLRKLTYNAIQDKMED